jgi:hypothetical protein
MEIDKLHRYLSGREIRANTHCVTRGRAFLRGHSSAGNDVLINSLSGARKTARERNTGGCKAERGGEYYGKPN